MSRLRFNRHTFAFLAILGTMCYAGAAQQNGSAYMLAFGLGGLVLVSWLHARQQLKGVLVQVGSASAWREGEAGALPLTLSLQDGVQATGLEVTSPDAVAAVFVERLSAERPTHLTLMVRPSAAGAHTSIPVILRSRYPLGFFTCERRYEVPMVQRVHPRSAGSLPLPQVMQGAETQASSSAGRTTSRQAGDDFDGVRLWQAGDPLRHVDWKAVARGRPLMVKQFTGGSSPVVSLDWDDLELPLTERGAQMARWVEEAEKQGLLYEVKLPQARLAAGSGPEHRRRVMDALAAEVGTLQMTAKEGAKAAPRRPAPTLETSATVPGSPLAFLCVAVVLASLPLIGQVPWGGVLGFQAAVIWRWMRGARPPVNSTLRVLLVLAGVLGIWLQVGSLQGLEAGIAIMLCVIGGKVLESRTARDLQVMGLLGWFLCLCCLVLQQDLGTMLYAGTVTLLVAAALVRFRRGATGILRPLRTVFTLAVQALPLVLVLFVFFPRGTAGLVTSLTRSLRHQTGISGSLSPGSIASVAQSEEPAFRVMIHGRQPDARDLYWRCLTLAYCEGMTWEQSAGERTRAPQEVKGVPVLQTLTLEPNGARWVPALDRPWKILRGGSDHYLNAEDQTLRSIDTIRFARRLEIESIASSSDEPLSESALRRALQLPATISPKVQDLARQLAEGAGSHREIVERALNHFASQRFRYSLQPGAYGDKPLEEFLFERKVGFCEHFAASFGTLMRLAGVPVRLVMGYQGGELIQPGDYYLVRQYNAHVWNEVWLEGSGWTRFDPTAVLAPTRLTPDFRTLLGDSFDIGFSIPRDALWGQAVLRVQMFWDSLNYQWFMRVVQFNEDEQFSFFAGLGLWRMRTVGIIAIVLMVLVLAALWLWVRRPVRHPDPAVRLWQSVCQRLAKKGRPRLPNEAPLAYAARVPEVAEFAQLYSEHRYGEEPVTLQRLRRAAAQLHKSLSRAAS